MDAPEADSFRQAVADARLVNRAGELVTREPTAVLECRESGLAYPVIDGIPALVPSEAVSLAQLGPIEREEREEREERVEESDEA